MNTNRLSRFARLFTFGCMISLLAGACQQDQDQQSGSSSTEPLFEKLDREATGIDFVNKVIETADRNISTYDYFYNGSGVGVGDINNDGLPDVFFAGNDAENRLYLNQGKMRFKDISEKAGIQDEGWATGVTMADVNGDGWLDIYVCYSGPDGANASLGNKLYINNRNKTFSEQSAAFGVDGNHYSTQAVFFDMDADNDLDLFVMNHAVRNRSNDLLFWLEDWMTLKDPAALRETNQLYRNEGNGQFSDISAASGVQKMGFGLGLCVKDFNEDGLPDVFVANDYFVPDFLYLNQGKGSFQERAGSFFTHVSYFSMGADAADFNNDGLEDMAVVDMTPSDHVRNKTLMASMNVPQFNFLTKEKEFVPQYMFNALYVNNGKGVMSDIGLLAGMSQTEWSWAPLLADFDNDGWKDLYITNGYRKETRDNDWSNALNEIRNEKGPAFTPQDYFGHLQKANVVPVANVVYHNQGGLTFEDRTEQWGMNAPSFSNGAAYGDLDGDGDLDLVVNNYDMAAFVYRNLSRETTGNHFLRVRLKSRKQRQNLDNAKISIYGDGWEQHQRYHFTRGYESSVEQIAHFGLGSHSSVDRMVIEWPDGQQSVIESPEVDKLHQVVYEKADKAAKPAPQQELWFRDMASHFLKQPFTHIENEFNDYSKEVLLPHGQSTLGPALTVGDLNGDGREDFFIGGAHGQPGQIHLQIERGFFEKLDLPLLVEDRLHEDLGASIFDANGDGRADLYVASGGGGDLEGKDELLQDRLYLNQGGGKFSRADLPEMISSTQLVLPFDWDSDGDTDLFIGGRTTPGRYPEAPASFLLENESGSYRDVTAALMPENAEIGMITDGLFSDLDGDGRSELLLVGEWMHPTAIRTGAEKWEDISSTYGFEEMNGWWRCVEQADLDGDGDADLLLGNIGLNNKFHPSEKKPLYVYAHDFDDNGSLDIVLSKHYKDKKVPVRGRECSSTQMPFLTEKFPTYAQFANASLDEIYTDQKLEEAIHYKVTEFAHLMLINQGGGKFEQRRMDLPAQLSPVEGIVAHDFNRDGKLDLAMGGSIFNTEVETPMYDAGKGLFCEGLGGGQFKSDCRIEPAGLFFPYDLKDLKLIWLGDREFPALLAANNNGPLQLYVWVKK